MPWMPPKAKPVTPAAVANHSICAKGVEEARRQCEHCQDNQAHCPGHVLRPQHAVRQKPADRRSCLGNGAKLPHSQQQCWHVAGAVVLKQIKL